MDDVAARKERMSRGVGVNDAPARVDEDHRCSQTIESLGEHLRFVALKVDHLGDEHRALDMRRQEPHPAPRSFIDNAMPLVAEDAEHRGFPAVFSRVTLTKSTRPCGSAHSR